MQDILAVVKLPPVDQLEPFYSSDTVGQVPEDVFLQNSNAAV
jgi:hypothetical protein